MNARPPLNPPREVQLAALLQLEQLARACASSEELAFVMVNETHALAPYRQAVLWQRDGGDGRIAALSGLAVPDANAPFNVWLRRLLARHAAGSHGGNASSLFIPDTERAMWQEHLPPHAWCLPLNLSGRGPADALLVLLRDVPWPAHLTPLLAMAADAYGHAWRALAQPRSGSNVNTGKTVLARLRTLGRERRWRLIAGAALLLLLCLPVRQSVLAPAEVVAHAPVTVRAPLQGVVDRIAVQPNQAVEKGQLLVELDARELAARLESSRQALAVAEAELRQGQQQALFDERSRSGLGMLNGKREQAAGDVDYLEQALARTRVHAERAGTVIFDDPAEWTGKPVALGERIMLVADPATIELDIQLPVADAIALAAGSQVQLFLNTAPTTPLAASVQRVGYRASAGADGALAYRVRARFSEANGARIGLKGTAKLYGERTLLVVYLLRRPLAALRVWVGL
ncbi:MAG: HlyD family efflux transporter periplasmic adaptor subunit [Duganella sp.]